MDNAQSVRHHRLSCVFTVAVHCYGFPTAFAGSIDVWSEGNRLHLSETPDKIILYIHVSINGVVDTCVANVVRSATVYHTAGFLCREVVPISEGPLSEVPL